MGWNSNKFTNQVMQNKKLCGLRIILRWPVSTLPWFTLYMFDLEIFSHLSFLSWNMLIFPAGYFKARWEYDHSYSFKNTTDWWSTGRTTYLNIFSRYFSGRAIHYGRIFGENSNLQWRPETKSRKDTSAQAQSHNFSQCACARIPDVKTRGWMNETTSLVNKVFRIQQKIS